MTYSHFDPAMQNRVVWNAGRTVGTKRPLTQKQIWAIRFFLDREERLRDRALFDLAIDSKLRGCDLVKLKIGDLGLIPESEIERREAAAGSAFAILQVSGDRARLVKDLSAAARASSGPKGIPAMLSGLGHAEPAVRYWSATGLGNYPGATKGTAGAVAALDLALQDKSPAVSIAAARALCRMGLTSKGLALLEKRLSDKNEWARLESSIVLDELDDVARPVLTTMKVGLKEQPNKYIIRVLNKAVNDLEGTDNKVP